MKAEFIQDEQDLFSYSKDDLATRREAAPLADIDGESAVKEIIRSGHIPADDRFYLKTESYILQLAYAYNKILSLSNSRTRILAHQVESTYKIVNALNQRFLIADEVGLGKTIEAGLVIKELIYRYGYRRIMIACPASLLYQWQAEMKSKFNENFIIMDRKTLSRARKAAGAGGNAWEINDKIICSLDFIKSDSFSDEMKNTAWDAVIFDEAHRLRRDAQHSTLAYTVAEIISEKTKSMLLLSATPFRGKLEELYYLIALLDRNILGPFQSFYNDYCMNNADVAALRRKLSEVVIRRTKREVGGFTLRHARTIRFDLYPDERNLYEETTRYVVEEFNRALQTENRAVGFVMTVFQKLLDSSSYALLSALRNRHRRLEDLVSRAGSSAAIVTDLKNRMDGDMAEEENEEDSIDATLEKTLEELKVEMMTIERLIGLAEKIDVDKKGEKLLELIQALVRRGIKKFLIFTQFRTTQDYLFNLLKDYRTVVFNGSMSGEEKEEAILCFKGDSEILIATEAGGEGRNMQFCNVLINYDLPWSPLKIEQRIGRIHRFGQPRDVYIYNFSTAGTVAERVLEVLTHKLHLFEESIGPPDVMLGQIEDELKLGNLIMDMVAGRKKEKNIDEEIDGRIALARQNYEKLSELTVADKMDFNYDEYYRITLKERQFTNHRIENFVKRLQDEDEFPLQFLSKQHRGNNLYPVKYSEEGIRGKYGTFDSLTALDNENLEFLAFGHPIIDRFIRYAQSPDFGGFAGVKMIKWDRQCTAFMVNYVVTYRSVQETKELVTVCVVMEGDLDDHLLTELELEAVEQEPLAGAAGMEMERISGFISGNADELFAGARARLLVKVRERITDMSDSLDFRIDPHLEKIRNSYDKTIKELEEKLELQESRMKWYGKDMRSAVTRTTNRIMKAQREKEHLIDTYKGYLGITYSVRVLNAGVLLTGNQRGK